MSARSRAMLDRYGLSSRALSHQSGERSSREPGQSVEFHDFRPYQPGDELRYVDWRVYARTGRLYTRLYQADRAVRLHLLLDTSGSMSVGRKADFARILVQLLGYVAQRDAPTQLHLLDGRSSRQAQGMVGMRETWRFVDEAPVMAGSQPGALTGLKQFALSLPAVRGQALVIVVSDLFEEAPIQPALTALRARGVDAAFLQVVAADDLEPPDGLLELNDAESSSKLPVGSDEVRAYREEVRRYLDRTRTAILRAGFKHVLLKVALPVEQAARQGNRPIPGTLTRDATDDVERSAFSSLVRASVLVKR
ncbi:MAG TPA: DUF58 domain-containing protein [Trueperaceae bacterium]|nr:DUF58 domain-containing protein [Trueperaceae bacterium]